MVAEMLGIKPKPNMPYWKAYLGLIAVELGCRIRGKSSSNLQYLDFLTTERHYDTRKAQRLLGYRPPYTLEQGMKETIEWCWKEGVIPRR